MQTYIELVTAQLLPGSGSPITFIVGTTTGMTDAKQILVKEIRVCNEDLSNTYHFTIQETASGGTLRMLHNAIPVGPANNYPYIEGCSNVLNPGDQWTLFADTASKLSIKVS